MYIPAIVLCIAGYFAVMFANPCRASWADGWRCIRRYPILWRMLAVLAFGNALFHFAVQLVLHFELSPRLTWARSAWNDPELWSIGSPHSLWWLPPSAAREGLREGLLPAIENVAGLFNNAITTFPLAVIAAIGLFINRRRCATVLRDALRRRFGKMAWPLLAGVYLGAVAVVCKAALYFLLPVVAAPAWFQWAPVVGWVAAIFEYLFGVGIQIYLILHAHAWVRGLTFDPDALREVAMRRLGAGAKWAGIVIAASSVFIDLPLILWNFPGVRVGFPGAVESFEACVNIARLGLAVALLCCAGMQAWLTLHGETLTRAWRSHWRFVWLHAWQFLWFLIVGATHLFALHFLRSLVLGGLGENTAPGLAWTLLWPWIAGLVTGWCLASWICLFKRCEAPVPAA